MTRAIVLPCVLAFASGCVLNSEKYTRPRDLEQPWQILKPRLLAVSAEPAEPRPGETVTFEALLADPTGEVQNVLWVACPALDAGGTGFGCVGGEEPELIGLQPLSDPVYTTPADLLDGLGDTERREGRYVLVQVTGFGELDLTDPDLDFTDVDFNDVEAGYKRVVVSEATTPNHNPRLLGFTVDGFVVLPGQVIEVDPGQAYDIGATYDDDTIERYEFLSSDGVLEQRVEEPYVSWYATAGTVVEPATLHPFLESTWRAPDDSGIEGTIWAVARDRRGGMAWDEVRFRVR